MAKANYFAAANPGLWQILGIRLRSFSLGHFIKLRALQCAFVSEKSEIPKIDDLICGIAVCSMSSHPDPARDEFWQWWYQPAKFSLWSWLWRKPTPTPAEKELFKWGDKIGKIDLASQCKLFAEYIAAHSSMPDYWIEDEKKRGESGAHWSQAVFIGLVAHCGYSQLDALNVPLGKALADYLKIAEESGGIRLMSEEESHVTGVRNGP